MKYGNKVCQSLKVVRKQIADANEIPYEITECHHKGDCRGTCPKCESELRYIENQLNIRRAAGKAISLVGLSLGISTAFATNIPDSTLKEDSVQVVDLSNSITDGDPIFGMCELQPEFPGGEMALIQFIKENLHYPEQCVKDSIEGRVTLSFSIEEDGSITNIKVMRSPHEALSQEAIRIVKSMPKWKPGGVNGKIKKVKYVLPITFRLTEYETNTSK